MKKKQRDYFIKLSDQELYDLAQELDGSSFEDDSKAQQCAATIFGNDSLLSIMAIGVPLSQILADRLKACSPHFE